MHAKGGGMKKCRPFKKTLKGRDGEFEVHPELDGIVRVRLSCDGVGTLMFAVPAEQAAKIGKALVWSAEKAADTSTVSAAKRLAARLVKGGRR